MSRSPQRRRVVVLISGRGSNLRALVEQSRAPDASFEIAHVWSDNPSAAGLLAARSMGVAVHVAEPDRSARDRTVFDRELAAAIAAQEPALIVLAGFMRILSAEFVAAFAGRIVNIHPSLLPKYPGRHTHQRVLEAGDPEHGATVHFVTEQLDAGPRVLQARLAVHPADTPESLAARVQTLEHQIYPQAVEWHAHGRLTCDGAAACMDGMRLNEPLQFANAGVAAATAGA